jgi:hypothetical protein
MKEIRRGYDVGITLDGEHLNYIGGEGQQRGGNE